jgi:tripartite-type tricarboxylate transporter receptor subunit TctC
MRTYAIKTALLACLCLGFALTLDAARPEAARTIKVVISVPPGGTIDLLVRTIADYLGRTRGQTVRAPARSSRRRRWRGLRRTAAPC